MNLDLRQLVRFLAIVDHGTFSAAAVRLHLTQQALSTSIARLEEQLGTPLFERSPGGRTVPTPYGRALARHARALLTGEDRALRELRALRDASAGEVTIGVGEVLAGNVVADAVARVHGERPEIRIKLVEGYSEDMNERLVAGEMDFVASSMKHDAVHAEAVVHEHLFDARDVVVARKRHPLARRGRVSLADTVDYPWIVPVYRDDEFDAICGAYVAARLPAPRRFVRSDTIAVGMALLTENDYLHLSSPGLVGPHFGTALRVLNVDPAPQLLRSAGLTFRRHSPLSPVAALLADAIRDAARRLHPATSAG